MYLYLLINISPGFHNSVLIVYTPHSFMTIAVIVVQKVTLNFPAYESPHSEGAIFRSHSLP